MAGSNSAKSVKDGMEARVDSMEEQEETELRLRHPETSDRSTLSPRLTGLKAETREEVRKYTREYRI